MKLLPIAIGTIILTILILLPQARRYTSGYSPYLTIEHLYAQSIYDALIGGGLGALLSGILSYYILDRFGSLSLGKVIIFSFLGWLVAAPIGGILVYHILKKCEILRMPLVITIAGIVFAACVPLAYSAFVLLRSMSY